MDDELTWKDATAQAELVRRGEVSPLELVDAAIRADRPMRSGAERRHPPPVLHCSRAGGRGAARRAVSGRADPAQGPRRHAGGGALLRRDLLCEGCRLSRKAGQLPRAAVQESRLCRSRPDECTRARDRDHHRAARVRADAQPLEHRALERRVVGWLRGSCRVRHGSRRPRQRRRRLDPHPGKLLLALRSQAQPGPREQRAGRGRLLERFFR